MVVSCCAYGCSNRATPSSSTNLSFYRIPIDAERKKLWLSAIKRENFAPTQHTRICSAHFISGNKSDNKLSPDYVPSIFRHVSSPIKRQKQQQLTVYNRRTESKKRKVDHQQRKAAAESLLDFAHQDTNIIINDIEFSDRETGTAVQTDATIHEDKNNQTELFSCDLESVLKDNQSLRTECQKLRDRVNNSLFDETSLEDNDIKVKKFTGLPSYSVLLVLFKSIKEHMKEASKVSKFQQFLIVLMRLRLSLTNEFLAHLFGVSDSSISRIFCDTINVINERLVPMLLFWPYPDQIKKTLPISFREKYKKCVSIIDCFEIFCERPSDLRARNQTYSQYKSHNTVKYLISVTPQGFISFISKGWGGRTSDKFLTENSSYLNNLMPGQLVLADRGFLIEESVASRGATLHIPAFTRNKPQLDSTDVETTKSIASVRIHVERVIGALRQKYTFLESTIPISIIKTPTAGYTMLDKIVRVACAMCNAAESVVPFE